MKVQILAVGRVRGPLEPAVREFEARAERYWKLEIVEVDHGAGRQTDSDSVREAEAERILRRVPEQAEIWALSRSGRPLGSVQLAEALGTRMVQASGDLTFAIGGAFGLHASVFTRAARTVSISEFTLPHEMARLVLAEQLYRAGTILRKEPYHKGAS